MKFMIYDLRFTMVRGRTRNFRPECSGDCAERGQLAASSAILADRLSALRHCTGTDFGRRNPDDSRPGHSAFARRIWRRSPCRSPAIRRGLLVGTALTHAALAAACWKWTPAPALGGWLALDAAGLLFLSITSGLFLVVSFYVVGLSRPGSEPARHRPGGRISLRQRAGSGFHRLSAFVSGGDDAGDGQPAFRIALGGHRSDHAGERAADLFSPAPSLAGSDLEIPAHLLGRHRAGIAGEFLSERGGDPDKQATVFRWCCPIWSRTRRRCKRHG